jgi:hypothetical protein
MGLGIAFGNPRTELDLLRPQFFTSLAAASWREHARKYKRAMGGQPISRCAQPDDSRSTAKLGRKSLARHRVKRLRTPSLAPRRDVAAALMADARTASRWRGDSNSRYCGLEDHMSLD